MRTLGGEAPWRHRRCGCRLEAPVNHHNAIGREDLKIYVGNMPYSTTSEQLSTLFGEYGHVQEATVIMDRETGRSKGFGFVDMPNNSEADQAIKALNATALNGRMLTVNQARPRGDRPPRRH